MAKILDGKPVAKAILAEAAKRAAALHERGIVPALAVIRTRNDGSATAQYEQMALDACAAAGVEAYSAYIPNVRRLRTNVENINRDDSIHGAIFLRPLPGVEAEDLLRAELLPVKDVDGVSFSSLSAIFAGHGRAFAPCPVKAAMELLDYYKKGMFPFDKLVKFYPFEEINQAFEESGSGKCIKAILRMDG